MLTTSTLPYWAYPACVYHEEIFNEVLREREKLFREGNLLEMMTKRYKHINQWAYLHAIASSSKYLASLQEWNGARQSIVRRKNCDVGNNK